MKHLATEPLLQATLNAYPHAALISGLDGRILAANNQTVGLFGKPLQQAMEQNLLAPGLLGEWTVKAVREHLQAATDKANIQFTIHGVTPLPALTPLLISARSFIPNTKDAPGLLWTFQVLPKAADGMKAADVNNLLTLIQTTETLLQFGSFSWDPHTREGIWSEGLYRILGYENAAACPEKPSAEFFLRFPDPSFAPALYETLEKARQEKRGYEAEYDIVDIHGKRKHLVSKGMYCIDEKTGAEKMLGVIRDMTEMKRLGRERDKYVLDLARSNKELEQFAYVASHDLQEPLRKILTFSDRLQVKFKEVLGADGAQYIERMTNAAGNMRRLIDDLLQLSRVATRDIPLEKVDLNTTIQHVINDLEIPIRETGALIRAAHLPEIQGRSIQLEQLFINIIGNALKFRHAGRTPEIRLSARALTHEEKLKYLLDEHRAWYRIQVKDNGIGFEQTYAERIFEVFQRLHGKSDYPGTGLGLSICKKIVERHQGAILAEGTPGEGASFFLLLPAVQSV